MFVALLYYYHYSNLKSVNKMTKKTLRTLDALAQHHLINTADIPALQEVVADFSVAITEQMHQLIDKSNPDDPIARQFVPGTEELKIAPNESVDPIGDDVHKKVKGIVHRYPDRCLFMPVKVCPVYCRFCFRKEKVGESSETINAAEMEAAFSYIESHNEIWEVIITGGDPLILKPTMLKKIITRLSEIEHVAVIRIHTRVPVVDSKRVTPELVAALKNKKTTYVTLHANHPKEFTSEAVTACAMLIDAGIPMLSQSVLLKNINDNIDVLSELMRCFVKNRIKPYYLHHCDLARGTEHFRTTIEEGQRLMRQLRGRFSGLCQPAYVVDIPGGFGKAPISSSYFNEGEIEDYTGKKHLYT